MAHAPDHIVFTTINDPIVLETLRDNLSRFGHLADTKVWVVGDVTTTPECAMRCEDEKKKGLNVHYLSIEEQDRWGRRFPDFYSRIPRKNETRRNIGCLFALEQGCERVISVDDDNFPLPDGDFIGAHRNTGKPIQQPVFHEQSGFHNICEYLECDPKRHIYPRGYPFRLRSTSTINAATRSAARPRATVGVTQGLWLAEPDIDATTWLNGRVAVKSYRGPDHIVLDNHTWSPINTQNTSVHRDLIPAFLCVPMGHVVPGGRIQRYGDIWGGYFLQAVMKGTAWYASFGNPLVEHRRNPHDYMDDLRHEFWGMMLTDWLVARLSADFSSEQESICGRVFALSEFLAGDALSDLPPWCPDEVRRFLEKTATTLGLWAAVCEDILR
jgi:hypothetical protein